MLTDACRSFGDDSDEYEDKEEHGLEKTDEEDIHQKVKDGARTRKAKAQSVSPGSDKDESGSNKSCSSPSCDLLQVKSKWCKGHRITTDNMRSQAMKAGEVEALNDVLNNASKVDAAIADFRQRAPQKGKYARNPVIDWGEFCRTYSVELRVTNKARDVEFTKQDFDDEYHAKGWSQARIDQKWNAFKADKGIDRFGRGACLTLWIPQKRERIVDRSKVQTNTYSEGSKREKRLKANDVEALKDHCHDTSLDLGDSFFKEDAVIKDETPPGPTLDAASLASLSGSPYLGAKGIDSSRMLPDQSEQMSEELEKVKSYGCCSCESCL